MGYSFGLSRGGLIQLYSCGHACKSACSLSWHFRQNYEKFMQSQIESENHIILNLIRGSGLMSKLH